LEFFIVQRERDQLLREKMTVLHNMVITDRVITLGILASGLGHYVRNSLVAVQTFLDLAPAKLKQEILDLEQMRNPNFWKDFYTHVQDQVKKITRMLDDLGSAAQSKTMTFDHRTQLRPVIAQALQKLSYSATEKKISFSINIPDNMPEMTVDGSRFARLFELLFEDEIASLPPGSQVAIEACNIAGSAEGDLEIQITVQDNGPGLPQDSIRAVFDPFFVRHDDPQHFGINLMASYFIIYHHGGRITVNSSESKGTCFTINLPINPQNRPPSLNEGEFLAKVFMNDTLWDKLLSGV
jgi:two-component system probable response regulator PhcQ